MENGVHSAGFDTERKKRTKEIERRAKIEKTTCSNGETWYIRKGKLEKKEDFFQRNKFKYTSNKVKSNEDKLEKSQFLETSKIKKISLKIKLLNVQGLTQQKASELENLIDEKTILCMTETQSKYLNVNFGDGVDCIYI